MTRPLDRMDLDLLAFLCICAERRCRVTRLAEPRLGSLERLRIAGLIEQGGFAPSPWAIADWRRRNSIPGDMCAAEDPPEPEAGAQGGGADARVAAAPPPKAANANPSRKAPLPPGRCPPEAAERSGAALGPSDEARPRRSTRSAVAAALAIELEQFIERHDLVQSRVAKLLLGRPDRIADLKCARTIQNDTIEKLRAFMDYPPDFARLKRSAPRALPARIQRARSPDDVKRRNRKAALKRIAEGKPASGAGTGLKLAQMAIERQLAEEARLADPLEKAKIKLRKRYSPVCAAEVVGGPKGKFLVGRRMLSKRELFALAEKLAA